MRISQLLRHKGILILIFFFKIVSAFLLSDHFCWSEINLAEYCDIFGEEDLEQRQSWDWADVADS